MKKLNLNVTINKFKNGLDLDITTVYNRTQFSVHKTVQYMV